MSKTFTAKERKGAGLLVLFLRLGGAGFCYAFAPIVLTYYFFTRSDQRRGIISYYGHLNGARGLTAIAHAFGNYLFFAASMTDRLAQAYGQRLCASILSRQSDVEALPARCILVGAHFGDWVLAASTYFSQVRHSIKVVMDLQQSRDFYLHVQRGGGCPLGFIDASRSGLDIVLDVKRALDSNELVCFLGDRLAELSHTTVAEFLGAPARFPLAPFEIAHALDVPVFAFFCHKTGYRPSAPYEVQIVKIRDAGSRIPPEALQRSYVGALEKVVRLRPKQWFNFFDFWQM